MKTVIVAAIAGVLISSAHPLLAQGGQTSESRIDAALGRARTHGVPVTLLESKIAEGKAKGVPMDRIAAAIEHRETALERAAQALKGQDQVGDADLSVGADALDSGVSDAVLKAVAESAPRERRAVAIAALTALVERGTAPDAALARVRDALKRGPDALATLPTDKGKPSSTPANIDAPRGGDAGARGATPGPPASVPAPGGTPEPRKPTTTGPPTSAGGGAGRSGRGN